MTSVAASSMMRIGEAAHAAGVTTQQLQYYLMLGVVEPADISSGRQRLFDRHTINRIKLVRLLNRSGYGLREIREIFVQPES